MIGLVCTLWDPFTDPHAHPRFALSSIFALSDHQCNRHTRIYCTRKTEYEHENEQVSMNVVKASKKEAKNRIANSTNNGLICPPSTFISILHHTRIFLMVR